MSDIPTQVISLNVHGMPCTNRCRHCWTGGSPHSPHMPFERIVLVLEALADLRRHGLSPGLALFLDEPTNHPRFLDILHVLGDLGLLRQDGFVATNGSLLAHRDDTYWRAAVAAGLPALQLTLYGLEATHDAFAGRHGAFREVLDTARKAQEHGIEVYAGLVVHVGNVRDLDEIRAWVQQAVPDLRVGAFLPSWQGRARNLPRLREADREYLPAGLQRRVISEREAVARVLETPDLAARRANAPRCEALVLDVHADLSVYVGGACDTAGILGAAPELRERLRVGYLGERGLLPLVERYNAEPPELLRRLSEITWGDLARRYAEPESDGLFDLEDLVLSKWAAGYLRATTDPPRAKARR